MLPGLDASCFPLNRAWTVAAHRPRFPAWLLPIATTFFYIGATFNSLAAVFLPFQEDGKLLLYFHCSPPSRRASLLPFDLLDSLAPPSASTTFPFISGKLGLGCLATFLRRNPSRILITLGAFIMATAASTAVQPPLGKEYAQTEGLDPNNVFVKHLPAEMSDTELTALFSEHGEVISSKIMIDPLTKKSLGYGYVFQGLEPRFRIGAFLTVSVLASRSLSRLAQYPIRDQLCRLKRLLALVATV